MKTTLGVGCGLQITILALLWLVSFPATQYSLNYWGSKHNQCVFKTPLAATALINSIAFGTGLPIIVAGGTFAWDTISISNDLDLPPCN